MGAKLRFTVLMKDQHLESEWSSMLRMLFKRFFFSFWIIVSKEEKDDLLSYNIMIEIIDELIAHLYL